jgi:hypothetical protein
MCLKQRRVANREAESSGLVGASKSEKTRREKSGPLYWKWMWSRRRNAGEKTRERKTILLNPLEVCDGADAEKRDVRRADVGRVPVYSPNEE